MTLLRSRLRAAAACALLAGALVATPAALARCHVVPGFVAQDVQMDMGQVVIPPTLAVGEVIRRIEVPINQRRRAIYCPWPGFGTARGRYVQAEQEGAPVMGEVYPTRVAGVGIRVFREGESIRTYYPHDLVLSGGGLLGQWYDLDGGRFIVELVKTAQATGSGPIAGNGRFTTYYVDGSASTPVLTSTFRGTGTTIVHPTCEVDAGSRNIVVDFGQVPANRFHGPGSRAADRDFTVSMTCRGSNLDGYQADISVRLDSAAAISGVPGVLAVEPGPGAAIGLGVEVVRVEASSETPVAFGSGLLLGRTVPGTQSFELPLRARYIQTGPGRVTPGAARATATFTIEYD